MRTIEEVLKDIKLGNFILPNADFEILDKSLTLRYMCDEILEIYKAEKNSKSALLDRVKQARAEMKDLDYLVDGAKYSDSATRSHNVQYLVDSYFEIINKLIAESEGEVITKEQEPKRVVGREYSPVNFCEYAHCPTCNAVVTGGSISAIGKYDMKCLKCGQKLKWE